MENLSLNQILSSGYLISEPDAPIHGCTKENKENILALFRSSETPIWIPLGCKEMLKFGWLSGHTIYALKEVSDNLCVFLSNQILGVIYTKAEESSEPKRSLITFGKENLKVIDELTYLFPELSEIKLEMVERFLSKKDKEKKIIEAEISKAREYLSNLEKKYNDHS